MSNKTPGSTQGASGNSEAPLHIDPGVIAELERIGTCFSSLLVETQRVFDTTKEAPALKSVASFLREIDIDQLEEDTTELSEFRWGGARPSEEVISRLVNVLELLKDAADSVI